jgi:hypothetical protein
VDGVGGKEGLVVGAIAIFRQGRLRRGWFDSASTCAEVDEDVEEEDDVDRPLRDYACQARPEAEGDSTGT